MARSKSRPVALSPADRELLMSLVRAGSHPAQQVRRARILLELDEDNPDRAGPVPLQEEVAARAGVHVDTVVKVQCLRRDRVVCPDPPMPRPSQGQRQVGWHFTTSDARTRLRHLYPEL